MDGFVAPFFARALKILHDEGPQGISVRDLFEKLAHEFGDDFTQVDEALWGEIKGTTRIFCKDNGFTVPITQSPLNALDLRALSTSDWDRQLFREELLGTGNKRIADTQLAGLAKRHTPDFPPLRSTDQALSHIETPPMLGMLHPMFAPRSTYVSPYASTQIPPPAPVAFQPYVHNDATVWADVLGPQPTPKPQPPAPRSSSPKNRKTRKRRSTVQYAAEMEFESTQAPLGTFRKRSMPEPNPLQSPTQIHRPYHLAAPEMAANLTQAAAVVLPEVSARLACIFKQFYGNLVLSKDLKMLSFIQDVQPIPEIPMLVLPITSITENPILSTKGSNPMEIRIKVNDANGEKTTYCFVFAETGVEPEPSQLMRNQIITAILSGEFGPDDDLPEVDDDDLPGAQTSDKGKEPERPENVDRESAPAIVQPSSQKTAKAKKSRQLANEDDDPTSENTKKTKRGYQKSENPANPAKPYECSGCGKAWKQSWGLHYHLTKSNTLCNPYTDLTRFAEKKERSKKREGISSSKKAVDSVEVHSSNAPSIPASQTTEEQQPLQSNNHEGEHASSAPEGNQSEHVSLSETQPKDIPLPEDLPEDFSTPTKKPRSKRGQPRQSRSSKKIRPEDIPLAEDLPEDFPVTAEKPKPKRGRPRKQPASNAQAEEASPSNQSEPQLNGSNGPSAVISNRREKAAASKRDAPTQSEETEQSDSADSEDSVVEFFKKHSTTGVERPHRVSFAKEPKISPSKKTYKALPFELSILQEVARELAAATSESAIPSTSTTASASLASQRCEGILISLVKDNDGIFPGDKSIWIAFASAWLKKFPGSTMLPESKLCSKTVDHLIETKKLRSTQLIWTDSKKRDVTRNILILLGSKINPKAMDELKAMIKQVYPDVYVPPQFAPPEPMLSKLNAVATRKLSPAEKDRLRLKEIAAAESESDSNSRSQSPMQLDDESSDDEFNAGEADEEEAFEDENEDEMDDEIEDQGDWQDDESDLDDYEMKRKRSYRPKNSKKGDKWARQRDPGHNKAISEGVRRNWATRKANRSDNYFPNRKKRHAQKPLSAEEKARRAETAYLNKRCWDAPVAYMPNSASGAWDQETKTKMIPRKGGRRPNGPRLPVVLTFMQAQNGAWSFQPYGHGAPVIYARPSRRVDEEGRYVERVHRDHRPIIFPTKNRVHLPAMLPKNVVRDISRVTGLPKRKYQRKGPKERSTSGSRMSKAAGVVMREINNRFPTFVPDNSKNTQDRNKPAIDEVAILTFFEPKKLHPGAPKNIGLESLPPQFGLLTSLYNGPPAAVCEFQPNYHNVQFLEPNIVTGGENPNRGSWTVGIWQPVVSGRFSVTWDDATALTMETLPFDNLNFAGDSDYEVPQKKTEHKRRRKSQHTMIPLEKLTKNTRFEFTRILTALPNDFKSIIDNPQDAAKKLGVQVAQPNRAAKHNRRIKGKKAVLSARAEKRLIVTVVVLRTLTGGLNATIDWVIVSQSFQDYTCNFLAKYWKTLQHSKKEIIERLSEDFQKYFPQAYRKNQIPKMDFNNLTTFQWEQLVKWVINNKNIDTSMMKKQEKLRGPNIEKSSDISEIPLPPNAKSWRDQVLTDKTAHYKKLELATGEARTMPSEKGEREPTHDELRVIRSWVRAVALTPDEDYDLKFAQKKLLSLMEKEMIKTIVTDLQAQKVLLRASRTRRFFGCVFEVTGKFLEPLNKIDIFVEQFIDAAMSKYDLDLKFWQGDEYAPHSYFADAGKMMCLISLQTHQMVRTDTFKWPSENKQLGVLDGGGYETRKIPRDLYTFDIVVKPTDKYVYDSDNEQLQTFLAAEPPRGSGAGELPLWYGVTEKVNRDIWKRVLCSVGAFLHCRSGTTVETIMDHFGTTFEEWELRILLDWGTELGLFTHANGGWDVGVWWWLMLGKVCDDGRPLGKGK
ncbi:hypothetical protein N431DRAFT_456669 [Stipitochalara longipes BDJ]|nr:hypothetical protein N431DRAFT_456669 [Stipitochalara longipes BDJ]